MGETVFGEVAGQYDVARPSYPDDLVTEVLAYAGLPSEPAPPAVSSVPAVAEIGAGTGKGTEAFVRRLAGLGVPVRCVETDPRMAAVLRGRFPAELVSVDVARFEDWTPPPGGLRLLYCAQAWHWMDPARRCALAHAALAPGGALALFGHTYRLDERIIDRVREVERRLTPELHEPLPQEAPPQQHWVTREVVDSGLFTDVRARRFDYTVDYPSAAWLRLVETFSPVRRLPEARRTAYLAALGEVVDAAGGVTSVRLDPTLTLARRPA